MKYWSNTTKAIEPYVPGEQPKDRQFIKLNTNETPYPPSPAAIEAIREAAGDLLRLYPDPDSNPLREAIASVYEVAKEQVFVGNGSDEILALAFKAFFNPGDRLLTPDITYSFYKVYAALFEVDLHLIPLHDDFTVPIEAFVAQSGAVIIPNPNAPTAIPVRRAAIEQILQAHSNDLVIVDEAYVDFGAESCIPLTAHYDNLLVIHTLSKSRSLAGLRAGFAIGAPSLIEGLNRIKNSFNSYTMDRLAIAGATAAVRDTAYWEQTTAKVIATRERTILALRGLGFEVTDSAANFVFARHPSHSGTALQRYLREQGILVRRFDSPRIHHYLRITVGTDEEMEQLIGALSAIPANLE